MALTKSKLKKFGSKFGLGVVEQSIGFGIGEVLGSVMAPETQALLNEFWPEDPNVPHSPEQLAEMVVQGVVDITTAAEEAKKSGTSPENFFSMVRVAGMPPGPQELLSMMDRGIISEDDVRRGLLQSRLKPEWVDAVIATDPALLQVAELAEMVVQDIMSEDAAARLAAKFSYTPEQFHELVRLAGSPPGAEQMLEGWNRGIFTEEEVTRALLQSRLKPEWVEKFKELRWRVLTPATAIEAVLRQRITLEEGHALAARDGMRPEEFDIALETMGRSMGVEQALQLARRGVFSYADFLDVVARSDVKTEFAPALWNLKDALPGIIQVRAMIHANAVTDEFAHELLTKEGYSDQLATAVITSGHASKTQATRDISAATIESLYVAGIENHPQAIAALEHLGYDAAESEQYLQVWQARRLASELVHGVTLIRGKYTAWKIDLHTAQADLADFGLEGDLIAKLLKWWTDERIASQPQLTHSMITTAWRYGRYTYEQALQLLLKQGWREEDAFTLLWNTVHGDPRLIPDSQDPLGPTSPATPPTGNV